MRSSRSTGSISRSRSKIVHDLDAVALLLMMDGMHYDRAYADARVLLFYAAL